MNLRSFLLSSFFLLFSLNVFAQILGATSEGGEFGLGVLFEIDATGKYKVAYGFNAENPGAYPGHTELMKSADGLYYSVTRAGGTQNNGVLFSYDPSTNIYSNLAEFSGELGSDPSSYLVQHSNGKIYGTTMWGENYSGGIIFEFDPVSKALSKRYKFNALGSSIVVDGLAEGNDGLLYGLLPGIGVGGQVFSFDPASGSYQTRFTFSSQAGGFRPTGCLFKLADGTFIGSTSSGGTGNSGTIFHFDPQTNIVTKKIDLAASDGAYPTGLFTLHTNGKFYSVTQSGGISYGGTLFEYDYVNNVFTKKYSFVEGIGLGLSPVGRPVEAPNGNLYGFTNDVSNDTEHGYLFEFDPEDNSIEFKVEFNVANGSTPDGSLILDADGKLYGMTMAGGISDFGTILQFDPQTGTHETKISLNAGPLGGKPKGLVETPDGKILGLNAAGGEGFGILFEFDPISKTVTKKVDISEEVGAITHGSLMMASNGKYYGTTEMGGEHRRGAVFEYDYEVNELSVKVSFESITGDLPQSHLTEGPDGKLYGTTVYGGQVAPNGTIFSYDPATGEYNVLHQIDEALMEGDGPTGKLSLHPNGKLYGLTNAGGYYGNGILFEFDPATNEYTVKADFGPGYYETGTYPTGHLYLHPNGKFYGLLNDGGEFYNGALFRFDPATDVLDILHDFDYTDGAYPVDNLQANSAGQLFGMTSSGGDFGFGTVFTFNPFTNTLRTIHHFNGDDGKQPRFNFLIPVKQKQTIDFQIDGPVDYAATPYKLTGSSSSRLPLTYASSDPSIASVDGGLVTMHKLGTVSIIASQAGSHPFFYPADPVEQSLEIVFGTPETLPAIDVSGKNFTAVFTPVYTATHYLFDVSTDDFVTFVDGYHDKQVTNDTLVIGGLEPNTTYNYRVRAVSAGMTSAYSNVTSVLTVPVPDPPVAGEAMDPDNSSFVVSWSAPEFAISYELYFSDDGFATYLEGFNPKVLTDTFFLATGLEAGKTYHAKVKAVGVAGTSDFSNTVTATTVIGTPVAKNATELGAVLFVANWTAVNNATGYDLEVSEDDFVTFVMNYGPANTIDTSMLVSGVVPEVNYKYRVRATFSNAVSAYSNVISVTTAGRLSQTITFLPIPDKSRESEAFTIIATSDSGLPVTFTSSSPSIVITGNVVEILHPGLARIEASQSGSDLYLPATPVEQTFCILPSKPKITATTDQNGDLVLQSDSKDGNAWYKNGVMLDVTTQAIVVKDNGSYTVQTASDNCKGAMSDVYNVLVTSIEHISGASGALAPNPANHTTRMFVPFQGPVFLRLIDATGKTLFTTDDYFSGDAVDVSKLAAGIYFVEASSTRERFTARLSIR